MRGDSLEDFKSAITELKRFRPDDEEQNTFLDETLSEVLDSYGYSICCECDQIVGSSWIFEKTCQRCRAKEMAQKESDLHDWETRHR